MSASVGPVEATERAAEDAAIQILLAGLEVGSIRELKRLVDLGRDLLAEVARIRRDCICGAGAERHRCPRCTAMMRRVSSREWQCNNPACPDFAYPVTVSE